MAGEKVFFGSRLFFRRQGSISHESINLVHRISERMTNSACKSSLFAGILQRLGTTLNSKLSVLSDLFAMQCNSIAIQRVRRAAQIMNLYSKIYDEKSLATVLEKFRNSFLRNVKGRPLYFLFGASLFNWEKENITEDELTSCIEDMDHILQLQTKTDNTDHYMYTWEIVINRPHLKTWRRPVDSTYLYQYKVYGTFKDISARAFYNVQVNLDYRKEWDRLVIKLNCVDKDEDSSSEIIHWVTHYPYPMYSRDYVFLRRCKIDSENKMMVLSSRAVDHPSVPVSDNYVRVTTYNSKMVIKSHSNFDENGFDYILTYYDDPQAAFPSFAYNWMASTGVPDFVDKLHNAARILQDRGRSRRNVTDTGYTTSKNYGNLAQFS